MSLHPLSFLSCWSLNRAMRPYFPSCSLFSCSFCFSPTMPFLFQRFSATSLAHDSANLGFLSDGLGHVHRLDFTCSSIVLASDLFLNSSLLIFIGQAHFKDQSLRIYAGRRFACSHHLWSSSIIGFEDFDLSSSAENATLLLRLYCFT